MKPMLHRPEPGAWRGFAALALVGLALVANGCSIKKMAVNSMAGTFAGSAEVFATDDDPELVRDALPFALKTMETLLVDVPENRTLLLAACSGFTSYANAFVQSEADLIEDEDWVRAEELRARALKLYLRGRDYGMRALDLDYKHFSDSLAVNPEGAVTRVKVEHIDFLYWTAAAWGSAIGLGMDRADLLADAPIPTAMLTHCLVLDETYDAGALHEVMIILKALPEEMGGDLEAARRHFARAVELSKGEKAGTFVTMAQSVSIQTQNKPEFVGLLERALKVDVDEAPQYRLVNILAQRKATYLLEHADDYILSDDFEEGESD